MKMNTTISVVKVSAGTIQDSGTDFSSVTWVDTDQFVSTDTTTGFNVAKMDIRKASDLTSPDLELAKKIAAIRAADKNALHVPVEVEVKHVVGSKDTKTVIVGVTEKTKAAK